MLLALAICDVCPSSEVDVIISVLMNLYDTRTSLVKLLKFMIDREIIQTGLWLLRCGILLDLFEEKKQQTVKRHYSEATRRPPGSCPPLPRLMATITCVVLSVPCFK